MAFNAFSVIRWTWEGLAALWLAGYAFTKPSIRVQSAGSRTFDIAIAFLGFVLLGAPLPNLLRLERGWLGMRFIPDFAPVLLAGFVLTLAGALFAAWARLTLGANWSGRPSVKAGHELIVAGPYALARHPIYTGLLLALLGTALAIGEWRALLGFLLIFVYFAAKISREERLMMQTFPDAYPRYCQRVKALIPGVL